MENKKIAILIPCYNEELTIGKVIDDFSSELPNASLFVYDNNSSDNTVKIAKKKGVIVRYESSQGKGNVIRRMFREVDADCYVMVDGDDTYSATDVKEMCKLILEDNFDVVIGDRLSSDYFLENDRLFHNFGNLVVKFLVNFLFKADIKDVMSGYRAFSYRFVKSCPILSENFEVETEMTIHAIDKKFKIGCIPISYKNRVDGSVSKLNTYKDGFLIIKTIFQLLKECRPRLFFNVCSMFFIILFLVGIFLEFNMLVIISFGFCVLLFITGIILEVNHRKYNQLFLLYLNWIERSKYEKD